MRGTKGFLDERGGENEFYSRGLGVES